MRFRQQVAIVTLGAIFMSLVPSLQDAMASSSTPAKNSSTLSREYPGRFVLSGSTGSVVQRVQQQLNSLGFDCGPVDGMFGPMTEHAVKAFQTSQHLMPDGVVGPQTWRALFSTQPSSQLDTALRQYLSHRSDIVSIAVYNESNDTLYTYNPNTAYDTASIVKVSIMGTLFYRLQQDHKTLTQSEQSLLTRMIDYSDNNAATALWNADGGAGPIHAFTEDAGLAHTYENTAGYWGLTQTTAPDQAKLMERFAFQNTLLNTSVRDYGLNLMNHVIPSQKWGVSGGVPSGVTVDLKNGWLPIGSNNWVINSEGYIHGDGRNYVIAVLSKENPTEQYGIETIQGVAAIVWSHETDK